MKAARARVLVVDNEPTIRDLLQLVLVAEGYEVVHAADGQEALVVTAKTNPDVILLDVKMPDVDGVEFARRYRQSDGPHAPIVVVTAVPAADRYAAEMSAEDYLAKPFDLDELLRVVARWTTGVGVG
jgi:CheY-like chemotaxis protein